MRGETESLCIWVDDKAKVVSFHKEDGYEKKMILRGDPFFDFILKRVKEEYRFK